MKTLILSMLVISIALISSAQYVNIPDTAFLNALIEEGVDNNGDSLISYEEAEAVTFLDVSGPSHRGDCGIRRGIRSLEGIEAFINLDTLYCGCNSIINLNLSNNIALKCLSCFENQLSSLDVSNNIGLTNLSCGDNLLTSLNIFTNTNLKELWCWGNPLTGLDVSNNILLEVLIISLMPTLHEVCVWEEPFPLEFPDLQYHGSPNVQFTTDCSITALNPDKENSTINIYPNPSDNKINIEIENINNATIEIYNVSGRLGFSKEVDSKVEKIDVSDFIKGIYIVKIMHDTGINIGKVVVR